MSTQALGKVSSGINEQIDANIAFCLNGNGGSFSNLLFVNPTKLSALFPEGLQAEDVVVWDDKAECAPLEIHRVPYFGVDPDNGVGEIIFLKRRIIVLDAYWDKANECRQQCVDRIQALKALDEALPAPLYVVPTGQRGVHSACPIHIREALRVLQLVA